MERDMLPLELWFVNVGHGDSTIVRFPSGRVMMVDINNCKSLDEQTKQEILESVGLDQLDLLRSHIGLVGPIEQVLLEQKLLEFQSYEDRLEDPIDVLKRECPGQAVFRFVATHPHMDHLTGIYRLAFQEGIPIINFWDTPNTRTLSDEECDGPV